MKTLTRRVLVAWLLLSGGQANAQTVEDIIERHIAAVGGRAALETLTSRTMTGTITLTTAVGELSGPVEIVNARPGRERSLITLDLAALGAGTLTVDRRFDGAAGYVIDSVQGNRDITGLELENMRNQATSFPNPFLTHKQLGMAITLVGREKVGDREAYVLIATPKSGAPVRTYLDAESFLVIRSVSTAEAPDVGPFEQTTELRDYRDVGGFRLPFQITFTSSVQNFDIRLTRIEHNAAADPSIFGKPAN